MVSLSARRAWIEIPAGCWRESRRAVALRKESVDRNSFACQKKIGRLLSLSARRAWIEIGNKKAPARVSKVALRKESVDRNVRPPAGPHVAHKVALRKESVDRNLSNK